MGVSVWGLENGNFLGLIGDWSLVQLNESLGSWPRVGRGWLWGSLGDITGGLVWSSGSWVGVVVRDVSWLILEAWGTGWAILWSVGSRAWRGNAVDSERSVVSVALWKSTNSGISLLRGDVSLSRDIRDHGGEEGKGGDGGA